MEEIKLNIITKIVNVEHKVIETDWKIVQGDIIHDIHPDAAKMLGTTQKKYRKMMNTKEGYKLLKKLYK